MRWIVDTSAWSRLHLPEVKQQIEELLADEEDELVLSPAVQLELLREAEGNAVANRRRELEDAMEVLAADSETFLLAADAMETLALHGAVAHRRPVPDLVTAALAHQHGCGVVHLDGDFDALAQHSGLRFEVCRIELSDGDGDGGGDGGGQRAHPARRQRELKSRQMLHRYR